jgi:hypothetical protein
MVIFVERGNLFIADYRKRRKLNFFKGFQKNLQKLNKKLDGKRVVA